MATGFGVVAFCYLLVNAATTYDDGFYYLNIAKHVFDGVGATFDGVHETSGFHPLWLWVLAALSALTDDPRSFEAAAVVVQVVLYVGALALCHRLLSRWAGPASATLATLVLFVATCRFAFIGLEFSLALCLCVLLMRELAGREEDAPLSGGSALRLGLLVALLVSVRLEFALLVPVVGVWLARQHGLVGALLSMVLSCVVGFFWAAFSYGQGGEIFPVSGWIKRQWSAEYLAADPVHQQFGWLASKFWQLLTPIRRMATTRDVPLAMANGLLVLGVFVAPWLMFWKLGRDRQAAWWSALVVFSVMQYVLYALLLHGGFAGMGWYYVVQPLLGAMVIAIASQPLFAWLWRRRFGRLVAAAILGGAGAIAVSSLVFLSTLRRGPMEQATAWVRTNTPNDARLAAWNAGYLGFYSGRQVFNLDGLVNDWAFAKEGQHDLCAYWQANNIDYIVDYYDPASTTTIHKRVWAPVPVFDTYKHCVEDLRRVATIRDAQFADPTLEVHIYQRVKQ